MADLYLKCFLLRKMRTTISTKITLAMKHDGNINETI